MFTSGFEKVAEEKEKKSPSIGKHALIGGTVGGATIGGIAARDALKYYSKSLGISKTRLLKEVHKAGMKKQYAKSIGRFAGHYGLRGAMKGAAVGAATGAARKYLHSKKESKTAS